MDKRQCILVIEQSLHNLELLNSHLKTLNFSCICTKQGVRGLVLAQSHQPDLILLDVMMPDLNGMQIIDYLKRDSETKNIPIIAVIPLTMTQECNSLKKLGAVDCITKPYDFNELKLSVCRHLNWPSSCKDILEE